MSRLVLVRHGESVWNKENKFTGWTNVELTEKGIEEAKEAAAIFDTMTDDLQLVADILLNMSTQARADILGKMDPEIAAKLTAIMEPDN